MPTAVWPPELPTGFLEGTDEETYENAVIASAMDTGPAKVRRRSTATVRDLTGTIHLDGTQKAIFDTFWRQTLRHGTLAFYLLSTLFRFKPGTPPRSQVIRTGTGLHYRLTLALEILP